VHGGDPEAFRAELTRQESVPLKLRRACEAAAMHLMRVDRLGIPKESRDAVDLLELSGFLASHPARPLRAMVGFSNVAVHDYRRLDLAVVHAIVAHHLDDLLAFTGRPRWASHEHLALADGQISKT